MTTEREFRDNLNYMLNKYDYNFCSTKNEPLEVLVLKSMRDFTDALDYAMCKYAKEVEE
jgi:hypothetical protein